MKIKERRSLKKESKRERTINRVLISLIVFLLAVIVFSSIFYLRSNRPYAQAEKEATALAKKYANLENVDQFYWYTREKTYFSLMGTNEKNQKIVVIIPKSGDKVKVLDQNKGLTEEEAKQKIQEAHPEAVIEKATLGIFEDQPVWEVVAKGTDNSLNYYLITFESGDEVKTIQNI
ncbi:DUF5590 domain-containing protein [Candidatus Enterococcus courvalinii]|uniref:DUF5590 domain-containing protein n=1 Tax=Candidatus Enterococcus courvalinii TaxID=2815329 RepID=A0ABS3HZ20_9ENTE|nr:DUF5590 domain-containing protein [Enterococcus sp. MSG2901]MBO0481704.1 DUF5590 domain-containing protein [Enterococcus sp. MSG2901]